MEMDQDKARMMLENFYKDSQPASSINLPMYEALMYMERFARQKRQQPDGFVQRKWAQWFQPPAPAKRQKKTQSKVDKQSIGAPSGSKLF